MMERGVDPALVQWRVQCDFESERQRYTFGVFEQALTGAVVRCGYGLFFAFGLQCLQPSRLSSSRYICVQNRSLAGSAVLRSVFSLAEIRVSLDA